MRYSYDANGNRKSMTDPAGGVTNYIYDPRSLLASLSDPSGFMASFTYDSLSRRTKMSRNGGEAAAYLYDPVGRLLSLVHDSPTGRLAFNYSYDRVGNRLSAVGSTGFSGYSYDSKYQLTGAFHTDIQELLEFYAYDPVGNRISSQWSLQSAYDAASRLTSDARFNYGYDAKGNLISKKERATGKSRRLPTTPRIASSVSLSQIIPQRPIGTMAWDGDLRRTSVAGSRATFTTAWKS